MCVCVLYNNALLSSLPFHGTITSSQVFAILHDNVKYNIWQICIEDKIWKRKILVKYYEIRRNFIMKLEFGLMFSSFEKMRKFAVCPSNSLQWYLNIFCIMERSKVKGKEIISKIFAVTVLFILILKTYHFFRFLDDIPTLLRDFFSFSLRKPVVTFLSYLYFEIPLYPWP